MLKERALKRLKKNLGNTYGYRNAALAKEPTPAEKVIETKKEETGLTILDLGSKQCKWPTGYNEFGEITFCGKKRHQREDTGAKSPYCTSHHRLGLDKYRPRRGNGGGGDAKGDSVRSTGKGG